MVAVAVLRGEDTEPSQSRHRWREALWAAQMTADHPSDMYQPVRTCCRCWGSGHRWWLPRWSWRRHSSWQRQPRRRGCRWCSWRPGRRDGRRRSRQSRRGRRRRCRHGGSGSAAGGGTIARWRCLTRRRRSAASGGPCLRGGCWAPERSAAPLPAGPSAATTAPQTAPQTSGGGGGGWRPVPA